MKRLIRLPGSPARLRADVDEELSFHLEGRIEDLMKTGLSREAAEREAQRRFGNRAHVEEEVARIDQATLRRSRAGERLGDWLRDWRYASRALTKRPLYAGAIILTLALGVGANAAVFSVVHAVLLQPFAVPRIDRLVVVQDDFPLMNLRNTGLSPLESIDLFRETELFESAAAVGGEGATVVLNGEPARIAGARTMGEFFSVFGVRPMLGRVYRPEDSQAGRPAVVVLSHRYWQQISGDSSIIGRTLVVNDAPLEVIGVLPPEFAYPRSALYWRPYPLHGQIVDQVQSRGTLVVSFVGRLGAGVSLGEAGARLRSLAEQWHRTHADIYQRGGHTLVTRSFVDVQAGQLKPIVVALLVAVAVVLLLACANVASLQLVRAAGRARELAVRAALGAGKGAITRQLLLENTLLVVGGVVVGLLLGRWAIAWVASLDMPQFPALQTLTLNRSVLAFTGMVAVLVGILVGIAPGLRSARSDVSTSLRDSSRGSSAGAARHRLLRISVVTQNALALLLLAAAGLTLRSLDQLMQVDPGFEPDHVVAFSISLPPQRYPDAPSRLAFFRGLGERLAAIPGIQSAGFALGTPFTGSAGSTRYVLTGVPAQAGEPERHANQAFVYGDFFRTIGIDIVRGRAFGPDDYASGASTIVVDENLVRQSFGASNPLGVPIAHGPEGVIVGVARAVKLGDLTEEAHPLVYHNYAATAGYISALTAVVKSTLPTEQVLRLSRAAVSELDPALPLGQGRSLRERVDATVGPRRLSAQILTAFAALSLMLALLGVYAVMSHVVSDRTREIGIRSALGAQRSQLLRLVLGDGMRLAVLGLAAGGVVFVASSRLLQHLLFGVKPLDAVSLLTSVGLLGLATAIACYLPARRAASIDPARVLIGD
jgi:predicted permease